MSCRWFFRILSFDRVRSLLQRFHQLYLPATTTLFTQAQDIPQLQDQRCFSPVHLLLKASLVESLAKAFDARRSSLVLAHRHETRPTLKWQMIVSNVLGHLSIALGDVTKKAAVATPMPIVIAVAICTRLKAAKGFVLVSGMGMSRVESREERENVLPSEVWMFLFDV